MKKIYISPATTLIKVHTENVLNNPSNANVTDYKGGTDDQGIGSDIGTWDGNSQPESAKGNDGFIFWEDEN